MRARLARQRGLAAVELALLLPFLVVVLFGMIDLARALQANTILVNLSREGANLAARGNTPLETNSQDIMHALMASAPPLNVNQRGMMYITRVMGVGSGSAATNVVLDQYRWMDGARQLGLGYNNNTYDPGSRIYKCSGWLNEACTSSAARPTVLIMNGQLADGEVIYIVETFYRFNMLVAGGGFLALPTLGPDLYSMTVF
ncbi:TadE/TadG family type IV pilus assembly protein [Pseudoduganella buxea]|uniref:TadE-like domain-containing protein n=1 Tax=Pseudoduganella buxea TaxID=1949069 RepID=A0A6I3STH2_9BURK|nr:TadE/TadG family type IV pilus assembly protein [Pseudoduganella buxea]MTV52421.1 hypothetical protein [Pseudoduganella buxea]GGC18079.1 hypothetical protein GCM10011572_44260 [Pseudoduganella buxea]